MSGEDALFGILIALWEKSKLRDFIFDAEKAGMFFGAVI